MRRCESEREEEGLKLKGKGISSDESVKCKVMKACEGKEDD